MAFLFPVMTANSAINSSSNAQMLPQIKDLLRQFRLGTKKRLGQHFLTDGNVLQRILSAAELSSKDIVVEVGPGLGILTERLAERVARVVAVELDSKLVRVLRKRLASFSNIEIVHADILKIAPWQLLEDVIVRHEVPKQSLEPELRAEGAAITQGYKVVANLPYYITSPILRHFLEASLKPLLIVVMVQKEVGEAMAASPGKMSLLSVRTQFYSKPTIVTYVPAGSFYPSPKVDSLVLRLDAYSKPPIEVSDIAGFFDIVTRGFSAPRKQLRNSLAQALTMPPSQVVSLLEKSGIVPKRRAETLTLEEWEKLWNVFAASRE